MVGGYKVRKILLLSLMCIFYCPALYAIMGENDSREYVTQEDWATSPYNNIVRLEIYKPNNRVAVCTAQYVDSDLILTAYHCISSVVHKPQIELDIITATDTFTEQRANIVKKGKWKDGESQSFAVTAQDWALLRLPQGSPAIKENGHFDITNNVKKGATAENWGFGGLRVIRDDELEKIKQIVIAETGKVCKDEQGNLVTYQAFLASNKKVNEAQYLTGCLGGALTEINKQLDKPLTDPEETTRLKKSVCKIVDIRDSALKTDCDLYMGNSGGPLFDGNKLLGVASTVTFGFTDARESRFAGADSWRKAVQAELKAGDTKTQKVPENKPKVEPAQPEADTDIEELEKELETVNDSLVGQIDDLEKMDAGQFLQFLGGMVDYSKLEEDYRKARARELSIENKLLGAAAIGTSAIGLSQTMAAAAEQDADQEAERDMAAYLATFRCDYGHGLNIKGGETNIELPGGNQLLPLKTQYMQLASDLKARKDALGLQPGVESEIVYDSATSGLYDNVSIGKTDGAFTSLARALMDKNSEDAKKWDEQKAKTAKGQKTGGILTATGVVGGAAGNLLINSDKDKEESESTDTEDGQSDTDKK